MSDPQLPTATAGEPLGMTGYLAPDGFLDDLVAELGEGRVGSHRSQDGRRPAGRLS